MKNQGLIIAYCFMVLGFLLFIFEAREIYKRFNLVHEGEQVMGTVVNNQLGPNEKGPSYKPVVVYDVNGKTYTQTSNISTPLRYNVGYKIPVLYKRSDPYQAIILNHPIFDQIYFVGLIAGGFLVFAGIRGVIKKGRTD